MLDYFLEENDHNLKLICLQVHAHQSHLKVPYNVEFARRNETEDIAWNDANEHRVVVHGLPKLTCARKDFMTAAHDIAVKFLTDRFNIQEANTQLARVKYIDAEKPIYMIQMKTAADAISIRNAFRSIKYEERSKLDYSVFSCVTARTRTRISILRVSQCTALVVDFL